MAVPSLADSARVDCEQHQDNANALPGVQEHGAFTLVLSGGSLLKALGKLVGMEGVQYDQWHVFYVDERNVPHQSDDSTHKGAQEGFLSKASHEAALTLCLQSSHAALDSAVPSTHERCG